MKINNKRLKELNKKSKDSFLALDIIRESIKILIFSSILVTFGGIALKHIEENLITLLPLLILIPALNKLLGDFGIIIVSRFTTLLYQNKIKKPIIHSHNIKHLFRDIFPIAILAAIYVSSLAVFLGVFKGFAFDWIILVKIIAITVSITIFMIFLHFFTAIIGGIYVYNKGKDPDDLLIPLITSISDVVGIGLLALAISFVF